MLDLAELRFIGAGLRRPECVLAHVSGLLLVPDWTGGGGISLIAPNGYMRRILATHPESSIDRPVRPNGIALEDGGTVLIAHLGGECGGIYRLWADGRCTVVTDRIGDRPMPPANFVAKDRGGRLWITISTTLVPRARDFRPDAKSGVIAVHEGGRTTIAADGLGYTNECLFSEDAGTLWVVETFARRLTAFPVRGARLGRARAHAKFGPGDFPDGLAEAEDGSIFVTSIVSNRLLRVWPDGQVERLLEDADTDHVEAVERAFQSGKMGRAHLDTVRSDLLGHVSNIAFGEPGRRTAYLGSLLGEQIAMVESPVAGRALPHWDCDLGPLATVLDSTP